jgi:hypothetical protein
MPFGVPIAKVADLSTLVTLAVVDAEAGPLEVKTKFDPIKETTANVRMPTYLERRITLSTHTEESEFFKRDIMARLDHRRECR